MQFPVFPTSFHVGSQPKCLFINMFPSFPAGLTRAYMAHWPKQRFLYASAINWDQ